MRDPGQPAPTARQGRRVRPAVGLLIASAIAIAPWWLMADSLRDFSLKGDDFFYLAHSRTPSRALASLWVPHNTHVVPLFRLWTLALVGVAGRLEGIPAVFGAASYLALVLVMMAGGHFVARETRSRACGLIAMAGLGITTVMEPSVSWYSASQVLWAGLGILATLIALQGWRDSPAPWRLGVAALAAMAAPAFWSGGFVAGPAGAAYLLADGRARCRKAAVLPLLASGAAAAIALALGGSGILAASRRQHALPESSRPIWGLLHTAQAIPEVLVAGNLGLDPETDPVQGVVFCAALAALWIRSRRGPSPRPNPLESAGAVTMVAGYLMAYIYRGYLPFSSLRSIGWYHAIPQVGAVLLAVGWWSGTRAQPPPATGRGPLGLVGASAVLAFVAFLFLVHQPRATRLFLAQVPAMTARERQIFLIPSLQRRRAIYLASVRAELQRQSLARLDRAERIARQSGIGREAIRHALGQVSGPGFPDGRIGFDVTSLLDLPEHGTTDDPAQVRRALAGFWVTETVPPPPWLAPGEPWHPDGP